jgi:hypothetical protein
LYFGQGLAGTPLLRVLGLPSGLYAWIVALRLSQPCFCSIILFAFACEKQHTTKRYPCRPNTPLPTTRTTRTHNATDMRLPSAYALTAALAFGSVASADLVDSSLVGTWATKANKTLTGPVRDVPSTLVKQLLIDYPRASTTPLTTT